MAKQLIRKIINFQTTRESLIEEMAALELSDWELLLDAASEHGLTLVLYDRLKICTSSNWIPKPIQARLEEAYLKATARNMRMLYHTETILKAFTAQNLDVITLKGIYLIEAVYASIGFRTFGDLDLLVRKQNLSEVLRLMQGLGYQLSTYFSLEDANQDIKHLPPMLKQNGPMVEIHWSLLEEEAPFDIDMEGIWRRAQEVKIANVDVMALDLEDLILHLSIHFTYQHRLRAGLRSLYDIALVCRKFEVAIDWNKLAARAKEWHTERVVWLTLRLVQDILGIQIPEAILDEILPGPVDSLILAEAMTQVMPPESSTLYLTPDLAALPVQDGWVARLKLIASRIFLPRLTLARLYSVDPGSIKIYGYYFVRFRELFQQYASSARRLMQKERDTLAPLEMEQANSRLKEWMTGGNGGK